MNIAFIHMNRIYSLFVCVCVCVYVVGLDCSIGLLTSISLRLWQLYRERASGGGGGK